MNSELALPRLQEKWGCHACLNCRLGDCRKNATSIDANGLCRDFMADESHVGRKHNRMEFDAMMVRFGGGLGTDEFYKKYLNSEFTLITFCLDVLTGGDGQ